MVIVLERDDGWRSSPRIPFPKAMAAFKKRVEE
jgi:hypothetical protein